MRISSRSELALEPLADAPEVVATPPPPPPAPLVVNPVADLTSSFEATPARGPALPPAAAPAEQNEWPGGRPEQRLNTRIEQLLVTVSRADQVSTVLAAMTPEQATTAQALISTGVTDDSLKKAYEAVLAARTTEGAKTLELSFTPLETRTIRNGASRWEGPQTQTVEGEAVPFAVAVDVGPDGTVNGKPLKLDELARFASELSTLHPDQKDQALRDAGLSADWLRAATPEEKSMALGKLRLASSTPGTKSVDLSFVERVESVMGEGSVDISHVPHSAVLTLEVAADGKVNGKTPFIETALATQLTMERLPMVEKRVLLAQLGFSNEACLAVSAGEAASILSRVSMATLQPGEHRLEVGVAGKGWQLGLKVGPGGEIEGAGASPIPPKPAGWKRFIGPVLSIASVIFPPAAPVLQTINAAIAIANGAKGLGLMASLASAAAGVGQLTGFSGAATLGTVASGLNAANGVAQGLKSGNLLGALSSVASLAGAVGTLTGTRLDSTFSLLGKAAGVGSSLVTKDFTGLVGGFVAQAIANHQATAPMNSRFIDATGDEPKLYTKDKEGSSDQYITVTSGTLQQDLNDARITQGGLVQTTEGNCFVLAPLDAVSGSAPGLIDKNVTIGSNDTAIVRLFNVKGEEVTVAVSLARPLLGGFGGAADESPAAELSAFKAALVQKAIVAAMPQLMQSDDPKSASGYGSIVNGWPVNPLQFLTGNTPMEVPVASLSPAGVFDLLQDRLGKNEAVVASSQYVASGENFSAQGVAANHAYSVLDVSADESGQQWVTIRNPWGRGELGTMPLNDTDFSQTNPADGVDDGVMRLKVEDFSKTFNIINSVSTQERPRPNLRWLEKNVLPKP